MAPRYVQPWILRFTSPVPCGITLIVAELVIHGRFRISKVAAVEDRLFEAFHSCRSEHGMPAHKVGACWIKFAALEAHFNGDRSQNTGLTGKRWKLRNPDIDPLYGLLVGRYWNLILTLRKARHREQQYATEDQRPEQTACHPDLHDVLLDYAGNARLGVAYGGPVVSQFEFRGCRVAINLRCAIYIITKTTRKVRPQSLNIAIRAATSFG
jgi:hypothetical protein